MKRTTAVAAIMLGTLLTVACSSAGDQSSPEDQTLPGPLTADRQTTTSSTTSSSTTSPATCVVAPAADVEAINSALVDASHIDQAFIVRGPNDLIYIGANIYRAKGPSDSERISNADLWIRDGATYYAMSGSAREYSTLPSSLDAFERLPAAQRPRAGDDTAQWLLDQCVIPAGRPAN